MIHTLSRLEHLNSPIDSENEQNFVLSGASSNLEGITNAWLPFFKDYFILYFREKNDISLCLSVYI